jgi:hypothetical protein
MLIRETEPGRYTVSGGCALGCFLVAISPFVLIGVVIALVLT